MSHCVTVRSCACRQNSFCLYTLSTLSLSSSVFIVLSPILSGVLSNPVYPPPGGTTLLIMSISFAGLGIISFKNPFTELASLVVGKGDIRSILCLLVFSIISLLLGQFLFSLSPSQMLLTLDPFFSLLPRPLSSPFLSHSSLDHIIHT